MSEATCERCGAFSDALSPFAGRRLCAACVRREAEGLKLYSFQAMALCGLLINPTVAIAMRAVNARRLHAPNANGWLAGAIACGVVFAGYMALPLEVPPVVGLGAGAVLTALVTRGGREEWKQLQARGVKKANPWWPVLIAVMTIAVAVVVMIVFTGEAV